MSTPEAGDVLMARALENVREHPLKFVRNWCANLARIFLDVPVTVRETPFWNRYSVAHLPLIVWTVFVALFASRRHVRIPSAWIPIVVFALLALGSYSFVSSTSRFLIPLIPLWWLTVCRWFARAYDSNRA
jgi:hypothetical protein